MHVVFSPAPTMHVTCWAATWQSHAMRSRDGGWAQIALCFCMVLCQNLVCLDIWIMLIQHGMTLSLLWLVKADLSSWSMSHSATRVRQSLTLTDGWFCRWFDWSHDGDSRLSDTNWPDRRFLWQGQNQSRAFLWSCVLGFALCSILLSSSGADIVLCQQSWWLWRKEAVIWIFWEGLSRAVLRTVVVNCQKREVDFLEGPVNLIKMHLSCISHKFLICDTHRQLLWWNIAVGNFTPKQIESLTIALLLTSCWWHNKHEHWLARPCVLTVGHQSLLFRPCFGVSTCFQRGCWDVPMQSCCASIQEGLFCNLMINNNSSTQTRLQTRNKMQRQHLDKETFMLWCFTNEADVICTNLKVVSITPQQKHSMSCWMFQWDWHFHWQDCSHGAHVSWLWHALVAADPQDCTMSWQNTAWELNIWFSSCVPDSILCLHPCDAQQFWVWNLGHDSDLWTESPMKLHLCHWHLRFEPMTFQKLSTCTTFTVVWIHNVLCHFDLASLWQKDVLTSPTLVHENGVLQLDRASWVLQHILPWNVLIMSPTTGALLISNSYLLTLL